MINRRGRDGTTYWRCTRSRNSHCTGTITTTVDGSLESIKDTHNHPPNQAEVEVKKIVSKLKDKSKENIRPVPQLYQEEIQRVATLANCDAVAAQLPTISAIKSTLYRQRRKLIPPLPTTREEVHFDGEWALTTTGDAFLLAEDGVDDKLVIFATEANLRRMAEAEVLYVDGTFHICPHIFYQVFTIHAVVHSIHIPLAYCLLPNKRQETYERVFLLLEQKVAEMDLELVPTAVVSDFELAIMQAAKTVFPAVSSKGCYFHLCQALIRKLQQLGLQIAYEQNQQVSYLCETNSSSATHPPEVCGVLTHFVMSNDN